MKRFCLAAWTLVLGLFAGSAIAAPFQNGSFDVGAPVSPCFLFAIPAGSTAIPGWTVSVGDVDWVGPCNWTAQDGTHSLDLLGNGKIGGVQQTFDTVPGTTYTVSFQLAGNPGPISGNPPVKPLTVTVAGVTQSYTFDVTGHSTSSMGWTTKTFSFVASSTSSTINFVSDMSAAANGFAGAALDNVRIVAATGTGLFSSLNPSGFGSSVTFTVQVLGSFNSPTGTVDFTDNGTPISGCTAVPLGPTGNPQIATTACTAPLLAIGTHTIGATYSGDGSNAGSSKTLTQVVNAVAIGGTVWTGAAGSVTNQGVPIPSSPTVVSDGTTGPAVFTYATVNSFCCHTGDWTFETTAATPGPVTLNWTYSGYHGTCQAQAALTVYVKRSGSTIFTSTPYSASDSACNGALPSGGFGQYGQVVLPGVIAGDTYGFSMHASNFDSNGGVQGRLTVTTGTLPTTTTLGSSVNPASSGASVDFTATVTGTSPTGSVLFTREGRPLPGCDTVPLVGNAAVCSTNFLFLGNNNILASYSGDTASAGSVSNPLVQIISAGSSALAPTLIRAVALGAGNTYLVARSEAALSAAIGFTVFTAPSCVNGVLAGGTQQFNYAAFTDPAGFFGSPVTGLVPGNFAAVQLNSPVSSPVSSCIAISGDNDYWPKALDLGALSTVRDFIDASGKARWYRFSVTPGQKIQVTLSGLPADYDLVVFKDIFQAFVNQLVPANAADLNKLSAEFAPSTFSPSTFSPSTFSPSTFSPDAYAPSTFSPSTFSPSTFSPSTFSPSTFSPSTFSPSTFSPSTFSPSTFSPSTFSPSTFSPSTFSPSSLLQLDPQEVAQAFSSAQTRSIIAISATPGTGDEAVVLNTWNSTGNFYVRVAGRSGAFSTAGEFTLNVTKGAESCTGVTPLAPSVRAAAGSGLTTVIVTDGSKVALDDALPGGGTLRAKLQALAAKVGGIIVDVDLDSRVRALKQQAANNTACPYALNLVAEEIKGIIDSYRANSALRYVVIAGGDGVIPFFRYPDESLLGQESGYVPPVRNATPSDASLSRDFVLSQDAYGSSVRIAMRAVDFPIPGLAVGRLVETPAEIAGLIDAYIANPVVVPSSGLVTGYDFLANVADAVKTELQTGGVTTQSLIAPKDLSPADPLAWNAPQLATALFGSRHDVVFLAGHFSANSALAADFTSSMLTTDLAASTNDFTNSIVFSAGCHAGYNIVDPDAIDGVTLKLDWPQAFAQKGATLIAGTGYQYGDTDFIEYSARLYRNFSRQLRAGLAGTPVSVGEALARAKSDYLATTPDIRGIHQKSLLETTLYGLPMLGVNMSAGRQPNPATGGVIAAVPAPDGTPASTLGLKFFDYSVTPAFQHNAIVLKDLTGGPDKTATWLSIGTPDGIVSNPAEPALPLVVANVTPTDPALVLRGVGFKGGSYSESIVVPLTGAPTTELRGVHTPFLSSEFFPMRLTTPNYFGALSGAGGTQLLITPAQHRAADVAQGTSTLRQFNGLNLRLYYSGNTTATALSAAPTIFGVDAGVNGGAVTFTARVIGDPAAAIHEVWVTYTSGAGPGGTWTSLPLTQCSATPPPACGATTDSQQWMAVLPGAPSNLKYIVQAVNGIGLVAADDNLGAYYSVGAEPPAATKLALTSAPSAGAYGDIVTIGANLSAGGAPVAGKSVTLSVGSASQVGVTDGGGNVSVVVTVSSPPGTYPLTAAFSGDEGFLPSSSSAGFAVTKAASNLSALTPLAGATLTGTIGGKPQPIDGSIAFTLTGPRIPAGLTVFAITNYLGQALLPPPGLAAGAYAITGASFGGNATYNATTIAFTTAFTIPKADQTITFAALPARTFGEPDFALAATTTSALSVSYAASGACSVTGASVHITANGSCTITASQAGNDDFNAAAPVAQTFAIGKATLIVTPSIAPASFAYGDDQAPAPITVTYGTTYSGTVGSLACLLGGAQPSLTPAPPAPPVPAGTYNFTATIAAAQFSTSCNPLVSNTGTLTVGRTQAAFANIVAPPTAPARTLVTITGQLNRLGKPQVYPKAADLGGGAFAVALRNAGGTVKTYLPSLIAPNGSFTITDSSLVPDTYSLEFNYAGGPNFLAATKFVAALRVIGFGSSGNMSQARTSHTATLLKDGRVLVAGGISLANFRLRGNRTAEIYCPDPYTPPATPVRSLAQWCPNGVGKFSPAGRGNSTQIGVGNMVHARAFHTATLLPDGTVLLAGGYDQLEASTNTAEIYDPTDPVADRFIAVGNLPMGAIVGHTATLVTKNAKPLVLVAGGLSATSQLYDPVTKTWTRSAVMSPLRFNHTASRIGATGSKVLIAGGVDLLGRTLQTTTIYDVAAGTFSNGPTMLAPRQLHTATPIANGKILLAGGTGGSNNTVALSPLAEIYDPANTTKPFAPATFASGTGRFSHSAAALGPANTPDGRVLITGGAVGLACNQQLATSEVYSGNFASGAAMTVTRVGHTSTVLTDGRVLITGGIGGTASSCGSLSTTEIWNAPPP